MLYYKWTLEDIESMFPFERTIYVAMMRKYQIDLEQEQRNKQR